MTARRVPSGSSRRGPGPLVLSRFRDILASQIGRHDHDGVLEIDRAPFPSVSRPSSRSWSRTFSTSGCAFSTPSKEQRRRVGADRLGQLAGLFVAHVSGRRADHPRHGCFSWYSDMSMRIIACSSSKRNSASARASSVFPTPVRRGTEATERPVGILQPGARATNRVRDGVDRLVLPDDALVQPFFHLQQFLDFALHHPADRNVRPLADDLGDVFLVDFLLQHPLVFLQRGQRLSPSRICFSSWGQRRIDARTPWYSRLRAARARFRAAGPRVPP